MGGVIAAGVRRTGADVTICARTPFDRLEITESDGTITMVDAPVNTDPASVGAADVVFLATKAQDTPDAAGWLARLCTADTLVVVAQNGLDRAAAVRPLVAAGEVVPAVLYIGAERTAPGRIAHFAGNLLILPVGPSGDRVAALLADSGLDVRLSRDFATAAWRKLLGNAVVNPITALTLRRTDVMGDPAVADLVRGLLSEALAVGQADGAAVRPKDVERVIATTSQYGERTGSSMLYDRLAGRPMEYDTITGEVVRRAHLHGLQVPLNATILALLQAVDVARPEVKS
jgi:2-dehydropantoate 2-reductase